SRIPSLSTHLCSIQVLGQNQRKCPRLASQGRPVSRVDEVKLRRSSSCHKDATGRSSRQMGPSCTQGAI
ncbi:hypothetical protein BGX23_005750, partial [Mortierella sp. AD031]